MKISTFLVFMPLLYISSCKDDFSGYPKQFFRQETEYLITSEIICYDSTGLLSIDQDEASQLFYTVDWGESDLTIFSYPWIHFFGKDTANLVVEAERVGYNVSRSGDTIIMSNELDSLVGDVIYWEEKRAEIVFTKGGFLIVSGGDSLTAEARFGLFDLEEYLSGIGNGKLYFTSVDFTYAHGASHE